MSEVLVCQSEYLAADDLSGKEITVTISAIEDLSPADRDRETQEAASARKRGKAPRKASKDVLLSFRGAKKQMRANPTNQWSIAVLLGSKKASEWIGKRVTLRTDIDTNLDVGEDGPCLRVAGSPDAAPPNAAAYKRAWDGGNRKRGALCKRCKWEFRAMTSLSTNGVQADICNRAMTTGGAAPVDEPYPQDDSAPVEPGTDAEGNPT